MDPVKKMRELLLQSRRILVFTGAGISTESGIADFRSPGGRWDNHQPVYFQDFLADEASRLEHWKYKRETWEEFKDSKPNVGHLVLAKWHQAGRLRGVITQNIDGLHQLAGLPQERVLELHGSNASILCVGKNGEGCGHLQDSRGFFETVKSEPWPDCPHCGGWLKPSTVSFGQSLDAALMMKASQWCQDCDLMLALGSSLVVSPANDYPLIAKRAGAKMVILNREATPLDQQADLLIHEAIGVTLEALAKLF